MSDYDDDWSEALQARIEEWQRRAFVCCDGQYCACGGKTIAEAIEDGDYDEEEL
jgi:hypothetical protein